MTTSAAFKVHTGNPGKRPIQIETSFAPLAIVPRCPPHLSGEARREWKRITAELHLYKMIAKCDLGELAMLCTLWARYVEAEEMIAKAAKGGGSGLFVKTPNGFPIQSPWLAVSNSAIAGYKALAADFGLSPFARTKVAPQTSQLSLGLELVSDDGKIPIADLMR
jgi:P27 family predicted phage terminase small subunit